MHVRTRTEAAEEPLFDHDLTPAPHEQVEELSIADDSALGRGDRRFIMLDDLTVTRRRHEIRRSFELKNEQEVPTILLRFCLKGAMNSRLDGLKGDIHTRSGSHTLLYTPELETTNVLREGTAYDAVEMYLTAPYLTALAERHPSLLDAGLAPIARGEPLHLHRDGRLTITPQIRTVLHQILSSHEQGPLRRMFIETKVTELLALQLQQYDEREASSPRAADLSKKDIDRMHEAKSRLLARMADPPSLPELARQVGTNEFKLKRDFKAVFGTTVYGLLLDHKMERAHTLLLDTDQPISEIAHEVGYAHATHFSTAFKKAFGRSPSALRNDV